MNPHLITLIYLVAAVLFIFGVKMLGSPATARRGNLISLLGMTIAIVITFFNQEITNPWLIAVGMAIGGGAGMYLSRSAKMTQMPELVALFNGLGGLASVLVALSEFAHFAHREDVHLTIDGGIAMSLSAIIGMVTFTGSIVAFGKLAGKISGSPLILIPGQHWLNAVLWIVNLLMIWWFVASGYGVAAIILMTLLSGLLGVLLTIPIGGADMPVVISLLNSLSGLAASTTGFVLNNEALIISGSLVGASGLILTQIMCKAMNRSLANVLFAGFGTGDGQAAAGAAGGTTTQGSVRQMTAEDAALVMENARLVIIVPGYGMAVAQAQHVVRELSDLLEKKGVTVKYAIHPVAGRMPGHMNVLLAEANVPYPQLYDMDDINPEFDHADVALVIGANDVTNPAARTNPSSPIYGMPILNCDKAKTCMVIKRSMSSGFAGIDNELYYLPNNYMLFGDAKKMVAELVSAIKQG